MATISDISTIVQNEYLSRQNLISYIYKRCGEAYLSICSKVPFEELQQGPETKACVIGTKTVDLTTLTEPVAGICSIYIAYSSTTGMRLKRDHVRNYDAMPTPPNGKPIRYARWGAKIELWPPPDDTYNLLIRYWKKGKIATPIESTTILIPDQWQELLIYETLYRCYYMLRMPNDAQSLVVGSMQPRYPTGKKVISQDMGIIPRLWNELLSTISQRENVDEDFSINPVTRV